MSEVSSASQPMPGAEGIQRVVEGADASLAALEAAAGTLATKLAALRAALAERTEAAAALERQLAVTEAKLMVETMHAEGLTAQAAHLLGLGADAVSALEPSGEAYADGTPKTRLALVYEAAFDNKGREMGVEQPERFRAA